jgi:hypothetical protein
MLQYFFKNPGKDLHVLIKKRDLFVIINVYIDLFRKTMNISTIAKYMDQPVIQYHLQKKTPLLLIGGGGAFALADTVKHAHEHKDDGKQYFFKNAIIIAAAMGATMLGARGLSIKGHRIFNGLQENKLFGEIKKNQSGAVKDFIDETKLTDKDILKILNKSGEGKLLNLTDIDTLNKLPNNDARAELFHKILGAPLEGHHHHGGHDCGHHHDDFKTMWKLSVLGLIPVAGGVAGGILADKITGTGSKEATANKFKEGLFQFLANIALCNVGAAITLGTAKILESRGVIKPLTRLKKMGVLLTGVVGAGIVGGSAIANYIGKKIINPAFDGNDEGKIYDERKPEMLDIALHVDDITAAGVISGFNWIEPLIPLLYFISGYRAGVGYRNGETCSHIQIPNPFQNHSHNHFPHKNFAQFTNK